MHGPWTTGSSGSHRCSVCGDDICMRLRIAALITVCCLCAVFAIAQIGGRMWARYEAEMQDPVDDPPGANRPADFILGRLRYRSPMDRYRRSYARWGVDANKCDRLLLATLQRL